MSSEKHCPGCGSVVEPGQPFCPRCGRDLTALWSSSGALPVDTIGYSPSSPLTPQTPQTPQLPQPPMQSAPLQPGQAPPTGPMVQQGGSSRPWPFAGEVLAERLAVGGYLPKPVADGLLAESRTSGISLVAVIRDRRQMTSEALRDAMARIFGLPIADLKSVQIDPDLVATFPSELAREHVFLPLHREGDRLIMVVADPTQAESIRTVRRTVGLTIDLRLATYEELLTVVHQYFSPRLVALLPSGETLDIVITPGELKIGRADLNEIVLPDPTVGSTHAILRSVGNTYHIVDFGSRNGVFVDGQRIQNSQLLKNGDVIQIGQCLLTFKLPIPEAAQSHDGATQLLSPQKIAAAAPIIAASGAMRSPLVPSASAVVAVADEDEEGDEKGKKKKKKKKDKAKEGEKLKSAWIGFIGRIMAQIVGAAATIILGLAVAGKLPTSCGVSGSDRILLKPPADAIFVESSRFAERINGEVHNASDIVPIADSKFLFVDNNVSDALYELDLNADGSKAGPLVRRPLGNIQPNQLDDLEDMTLAEQNGKKFVLATTSLLKRQSKKKGEFGDPPSGLLRIAVAEDGTLTTDSIFNFREWFLTNVKDLVPSAALSEPDDNGLNVEGLAWDAANSRLLFGLRTPALANRVFVVPVKVKDLAGAWDASNLEVQPAIKLSVEDTGQDEGIRSLEWDDSRKTFLVLVGNATSESKAPFLLYRWDGGADGATTRFKGVWFDSYVKAEGVTHATIGGKGALVFSDDAGGYAVIWDEEARLQQ